MRFPFSLWLYHGLASQVLCVMPRQALIDDLSIALAAWTRLVKGLPSSMAERVKLTRHVAISTGRRIASRLDRPGQGRSTALVRSTHHISFTCNFYGCS